MALNLCLTAPTYHENEGKSSPVSEIDPYINVRKMLVPISKIIQSEGLKGTQTELFSGMLLTRSVDIAVHRIDRL
jgi:hypothetical protein